MKHLQLINEIEKEFNVQFTNSHKEFIIHLEEKCTIPSKMAGEVFQVISNYKLYGGINNTWKAYNTIICIVGEYRDEEFYRTNGMIDNNTVREEINLLLDSLRFGKQKINKLISESQNEEPQMTSLISLMESFQMVLEERKGEFPYIPKN